MHSWKVIIYYNIKSQSYIIFISWKKDADFTYEMKVTTKKRS